VEVFLFVLMLAGFGLLLFRISELERRLEKVERRPISFGGAAPHAAGTTSAPSTSPVIKPATPAPAAPVPAQAPAGWSHAPAPEHPSAPKPQPGRPAGQRVRAWLEENGLAWAGGAVLALGGLFLAAYAAQRGVLTPPLRIAAAVAVGAVLIGASEWLRSRARTDVRGHPLAAALIAGAGAATLYGAAWAAHSMYGLVGAAAAAAMLGLTSLGLLALALRHGEPLALLAIAGGFLAPAVTGAPGWSLVAQTAYLGLLIATGFGVAALRRWGQAGFATLGGAFLWAFAALMADSPLRAAALMTAAAACALLAAEWDRRRSPRPQPNTSFGLVAPLAFVVSPMVFAILWGFEGVEHYAGAAVIALAGLCAVGLHLRLIAAPIQLAVYFCFAAPVYWAAHKAAGQASPGWLAALALAAAVAGLANALLTEGSARRWSGAGALTALALTLTIGPGPWPAWLPEAVAAVLLAGAARLVKASADAEKGLTPAYWIWTAGAAALAAVAQGVEPRALPTALAVLTAGVALTHARLRWWGLQVVALAASLAALIALLSPAMFEALAAGRLAWPWLAAGAASAAFLIWLAARITARSDGGRTHAEALRAVALVLLVSGGFLLLRPWGPGGSLDPFLEAGVRTLLLLVAGIAAALAAAPSDGRPEQGVIGRWLGQALLIGGAAHALLVQLLLFNPLWASWTPAISGPPVFDSLTAGLLAPAVVLGSATLGKVSTRRWLLGLFAVSGAALGFVWTLLELRRLFQGPTLHGAPDVLGRVEIAAYALTCLLAAAATLWIGHVAQRRRLTVSPLAREIATTGEVVAWAALLLALVVFGYGASPWWGPLRRPLDGAFDAALLLGIYAAAAGVLTIMSLRLNAGRELLRRAMRLGAAALAFALVTLVVRTGFRGLDMRPDGREAGLETWAFSAAWGLFGFALLVGGVARRINDLRFAGLAVLLVTLAKVFLFDMARLDGVVRAASFLAVGAVLLAASVLVRRLSGEPGAWRLPAATPLMKDS
jgi:hypothetical protein